MANKLYTDYEVGAIPHREYPRPQLRRESFLCLNGTWEYAITDGDRPAYYDGEILVPFSPEAPLSGVERILSPEQTLWYRRRFVLPDKFMQDRLLLHFGAVDQCCTVYLNGQAVGSHEGGYLPFCFDVTDALEEDNELVVQVRDFADTSYYSTGKQRHKRGGIWYTPQSGIWGTVWCESVPTDYIQSVRITPLYDIGAVRLDVETALGSPVYVEILDGETVVAKGAAIGSTVLDIPDFRAWSPDDPFLYNIRLSAEVDRAESYFGMRKTHVAKDNLGIPRLFLNDRPVFHNGLLDQGYWPDGLYTPPSEQAMVEELEAVKRLGFNMLRKHIKVEPLRWYYHCDRLGLMVWQDMPCGCTKPVDTFKFAALPTVGLRYKKDNNYAFFGRTDAQGRAFAEREMLDLVSLLYNSPSVVLWVPFNEGWGQFDAARICERLRKADDTRPIDHASGWFDQGLGDLNSRHIYFSKVAIKPDGRVSAVTEFGGYALAVEGHTFGERGFGYKGYKNEEELTAAYAKLYEEQILPQMAQGLSAAVYTQLTDVEDELNGLYTYDRKKLKIDEKMIKSINNRLKY